MKKLVCILLLAGAATVLGGSSASAHGQGEGHTPVVFYHKPGTPAAHQLETDDDGFLQGHLGHGDSLVACPVVTDEPTDDPSSPPADDPTDEPTDTETTPPADDPTDPPAEEPTDDETTAEPIAPEEGFTPPAGELGAPAAPADVAEVGTVASSPELAETGVPAGALALGGGVLVAAGAALLGLKRRLV